MRLKNEFQFFIYLVLIAAAWVPISAWLMPRIALAPTWEANPSWYVSSGVMGVLLAYVLRFLAAKFNKNTHTK